MKAYIARKILHAFLTLFAIVTTLFILFHVRPMDTTDRVISQTFNWPGLGKLLVQSAASNDYPVLQATFLFLTVLVFLNFMLDISYRYFSPGIGVHRR